MDESAFDKSGNTGLRHLVNATRFSAQGFRSAFVHESAFRQELAALIIVLPTGAWFAASAGIFLALFCACLLVLAVELLNSGIESAVDRIGLHRDELARNAKDYGSAAVMLTLIMAGSIWCYILYTALVKPL